MTAPFPTLAIALNRNNPEPCQALSAKLQLPLVDQDALADYPYVLLYSPEGLAIQQTGPKAAGPVVVNFEAGKADHRRKFGGGELIVKAVGGDKTQRPSVLDATAGLGRDSFVLATAGYRVTLCERSPIVAAVLADGLNRAAQFGEPQLQQIVGRMNLQPLDAINYLQQTGGQHQPDVIVIDPMFPESKKSAMVKKDMRAFHYVVGADEDSDQLISLALSVARHRVVVKRPKKADYLAAKTPSYSLAGKAIRYDIYSLKAFGK